MAQPTHSQDSASHGHDRRDDGSGDLLENAMEIAGNFGEEKEKKSEAHCQACHVRTQNANTMATTAAVFSVGAFLLSIAAVVLPFLKNTDVTFDAKAWADFLSTLEERAAQDEVPVPEAFAPSSVRLPLRPRTVPASKPSASSPTTPARSSAGTATSAPASAATTGTPASEATTASAAPAPSSTAPASQQTEPTPTSLPPRSAAPADAGTPAGTLNEAPAPADGGTTDPVKPPVLPDGSVPADSGSVS